MIFNGLLVIKIRLPSKSNPAAVDALDVPINLFFNPSFISPGRTVEISVFKLCFLISFACFALSPPVLVQACSSFLNGTTFASSIRVSSSIRLLSSLLIAPIKAYSFLDLLSNIVNKSSNSCIVYLPQSLFDALSRC